MIEVVTGTPGAGKTLFAITKIKERAEKENRPVFYSGIADLKLPWTEIDPEKWFDCPVNAIIVIDECQRVFRPRSFGSNVPDYVAKLETHRHSGHDIYLITQHPMLIDTNVRRLCGTHWHVSRRMGMKRATILEFPSIKDQPLSKISEAVRHEWAYPKETFDYYKSAEVHTHKVRIPMKVWVLLSLPFLLGGLVWFVYNRHFEDGKPKLIVGDSSKTESGTSAPVNSKDVKRIAMNDYAEENRPRIEGLPHTAPKYDEVMAPVRAPYPAACAKMGEICKCYTEQGTRLFTSQAFCSSFIEHGYFVDHDNSNKLPIASSSQDRLLPVAVESNQSKPEANKAGSPRSSIASIDSSARM